MPYYTMNTGWNLIDHRAYTTCQLVLVLYNDFNNQGSDMKLYTSILLDGHGKARREAARRRKSVCKINFRKTKFLSSNGRSHEKF